MRGWFQPRERIRDEWPRNGWLWYLAVVFVIFALYEALR